MTESTVVADFLTADDFVAIRDTMADALPKYQDLAREGGRPPEFIANLFVMANANSGATRRDLSQMLAVALVMLVQKESLDA